MMLSERCPAVGERGLCLRGMVASSRKPLGDGEIRRKSMNFFVEKFNFKPMFTSEELFSKVNPTHKSSFSKCAFSSLKHLQVDLFSIPRLVRSISLITIHQCS